MVSRYTKTWPEEVTRYINENITAEEAAKAYDVASLELHGKYGYRNFS